MVKTPTFLLLFILVCCGKTFSQKINNQDISKRIQDYKTDIRGPYKDIRWFCTDGSIRQPKDPCPDPIGPGVQHARYKDEVIALGKSNHIYLGQILAYTDKADFWDAENNHSRLKQYQLEKYLTGVDNGWINRKGQFYRGAIQAEDEAAWGIEFFTWLLSQDNLIKKNYFLIRQSLKDIPHQGDDNLSQLIRSKSKVISDEVPEFMDLRVKIHSQPEVSDVERVKDFKTSHNSKLTQDQMKALDDLIRVMTTFFKPVDIASLNKDISLLKSSKIGQKIDAYVASNSRSSNVAKLVSETSELLYDIRNELLEEKQPKSRLQLLDLSLKLENIIYKNAPNWETEDVGELIDKVCYLGMASVGAGYIERSEWDALSFTKTPDSLNAMTLGNLTTILQNAQREVEWSASMFKANYKYVVNEFLGFEPLSSGFIDDKIRGSIALPLGQTVSKLGDFIAEASELTNKVMDIPNQSGFRGLNPGYTLGPLVVVSGDPDEVEVSSDNIYIFQRPPSDLKPVAGIATVSEGNLVSHVQLLARNLGIPNAALSDENLRDLQKFNGQIVFYAVSNKGNVIMKPESTMTAVEKSLFEKTERKEEKVKVPVEQIRLDQTHVVNLRTVDADDSGKLCGPKAANLGQLKKMFPDRVVEGMVIPFGIFRDHMNQTMSGQNMSYWEFLKNTFKEAEKMQAQGITETDVEKYQLQQLSILRDAIRAMPLKADFVSELETDFQTILGKDLGDIPVFLRSDTNMEDLKDFTGAGLNLTLFNVRDKGKILDGIKEVWASPYSERSFKWRQKFLLNPENVFPSILVIPSVDVDYSGVLITKGISNGNDKDLTVAFSRGAGGAVDGQFAETYVIFNSGSYQLLAPSRETLNNSLPESGGVGKKQATFEQPILSEQNLNQIRAFAQVIRERLPKETDADYHGAYDVELGFKNNKIWLFQIRPFVENKKALSSSYLETITPTIDKNKKISLNQKINDE
ncbi:PEP/pyruvate-binding domain-containing protein [Gaetbulibacter sp. M240]|uniref:PEP/pyruvate-binding domain-containing protein n=1 Tax=Gaetbulibacter sp. M240 TaxID=3126511 RepID=UPI00374F6723